MQLYQQHQVRESAKIYFASSGKVSFCIENARAATALWQRSSISSQAQFNWLFNTQYMHTYARVRMCMCVSVSASAFKQKQK